MNPVPIVFAFAKSRKSAPEYLASSWANVVLPTAPGAETSQIFAPEKF